MMDLEDRLSQIVGAYRIGQMNGEHIVIRLDDHFVMGRSRQRRRALHQAIKHAKNSGRIAMEQDQKHIPRTDIAAFAVELERHFREILLLQPGDEKWKASTVAWIANQLEPRFASMKDAVQGSIQDAIDPEKQTLSIDRIKKEALSIAAGALMVSYLCDAGKKAWEEEVIRVETLRSSKTSEED